MIGSVRHLTLVISLPLILSACLGGGNFAPVSDRYSPPEKRPEHYRVTSGDTVYSIAWRYGLDYRRLAAANNIAAPYPIFPGQQLLLREGTVSRQARSVSASQKPPAIKSAPKESVSPTVKTVAKNTTTKGQKSQSVTFTPGHWLWPHNGKLTKRFSPSGYAHKGIDIAGKLEEPVMATAAGVVVYAGSGLVGYGNLLIVKHSDRYLSAYAHNSRLLVDEGEIVKSGQRIATLGDTGTDSPKLHFEIRRDGKPVDPLKLLPGRK